MAETPSTPEAIKGKLEQASDEFEEIVAANQKLLTDFESHQWSGLDDLHQSANELARARDQLGEIAYKVGLTHAVAESYATHQMVGDKESLGRT